MIQTENKVAAPLGQHSLHLQSDVHVDRDKLADGDGVAVVPRPVRRDK